LRAVPFQLPAALIRVSRAEAAAKAEPADIAEPAEEGAMPMDDCERRDVFDMIGSKDWPGAPA